MRLFSAKFHVESELKRQLTVVQMRSLPREMNLIHSGWHCLHLKKEAYRECIGSSDTPISPPLCSFFCGVEDLYLPYRSHDSLSGQNIHITTSNYCTIVDTTAEFIALYVCAPIPPRWIGCCCDYNTAQHVNPPPPLPLPPNATIRGNGCVVVCIFLLDW